MTFDPTFVFYRDDREVAAWETLADMHAEAVAELADRRDVYPGLVAKGRMARDDADRELRVMGAIAGALDVLNGRVGADAASWTERVTCLRRAILLRRECYPTLVLQGRLDADDATRKLRMMESIHDMTWHGDWTPEAVAGRAAVDAMQEAK